MIIRILTLFPDFFQTPLASSILKRAVAMGKVQFEVVNIRDYAQDKHKITDDRPYGGGAGMVMKVEPIDQALQASGVHRGEDRKKIVLTSAKGAEFTQKTAQDWSNLRELTIICGHYEGVDERVAENLVDEEIRIGEYVLTGGEPAALVLSDAVTRLLPGVLGNEDSTKNESHVAVGVLGYPQYTRPEVYKGWKVPELLLQGNHSQIQSWREQQKSEL